MDMNITNKEKIWRISSLTAAVDEDTKIVILPLADSKRKIKTQDTKYTLQTYKDLF
jgi:hypothetical protein